jgi:hypothetical protein
MPAVVRRPSRRAAALLRLALVAGALAAAACSTRSPVAPSDPGSATPAPGAVRIMGPSRLTASQIVAWVRARTPQPSGTYAATVPVETLAQSFLEEGAAEGVTGDVAFMQSIVETGWFRFAGAVPAWKNNFAGLGAVDASPGDAAAFPDARTGVRAQIQHLRAYADPTATACAVPPLHNPCVDPRFDLVTPKGRATTWNQMGNGNWATASTYASSILSLFTEALGFNGVS